MPRPLVYRNIRAGSLLDLFLVSAITSLLAVRFYLYAAGYPQIGSGTFHIAHMLWGGLLMLAGITVLLAFIGWRAQQLGALLSGIGFGVFIDELGKFITQDNNYFFRPTVGIIYALFAALYLVFNFLSRRTRYTSREYQINVLLQLEEVVGQDFDVREKTRARTLLAMADQNNAVTKQLERLVDTVGAEPAAERGWLYRVVQKVNRGYALFWSKRQSNRAVQIFFVLQAGFLLLAVLFVSILPNIDVLDNLAKGRLTYDAWLIIGQFASALLAGVCVVLGVVRLPLNRVAAFEWFRRAALVNLFLTEFFIFSRLQFAALPGFVGNVVLLLIVTFVLRHEQQATA